MFPLILTVLNWDDNVSIRANIPIHMVLKVSGSGFNRAPHRILMATIMGGSET